MFLFNSFRLQQRCLNCCKKNTGETPSALNGNKSDKNITHLGWLPYSSSENSERNLKGIDHKCPVDKAVELAEDISEVDTFKPRGQNVPPMTDYCSLQERHGSNRPESEGVYTEISPVRN